MWLLYIQEIFIFELFFWKIQVTIKESVISQNKCVSLLPLMSILSSW